MEERARAREKYLVLKNENVRWKIQSSNMLHRNFLYIFASFHTLLCEPGYRSRYSDWLRAGRPRGRGSSPGRVKNFHFSMSSRPVLGSTQPPILSPG
jgi:hypothetical protein